MSFQPYFMNRTEQILFFSAQILEKHDVRIHSFLNFSTWFFNRLFSVISSSIGVVDIIGRFDTEDFNSTSELVRLSGNEEASCPE